MDKGETFKGQCLTLIGMPSSGKSTIGKILSRDLKMKFVDTDQRIVEKDGRTPRDIVSQDGLEVFMQLQEQVAQELQEGSCVIATGGSMVLCAGAMMRIKELGSVVFLQVQLEEIDSRLLPGRRFARSSGESLEDMYRKRLPYYLEYADFIVDCSGKDEDTIAREIAYVYITDLERG